ncbi:hypothetical protein SeLEV6574_g03161 [Synchytrium endobioticum]|nr:hypothetical protein SeLEV6574_g03161 [Synchytrium endobioticum]
MADYRSLAERLRQAPFNKHHITAVQLVDDCPPHTLLQFLSDTCAYIDSANASSSSLYKMGCGVSHEDPNDLAWRLTDYLSLLKYKPAMDDPDRLHHDILQGNASAILSAMWYLLKDEEAHKKRAYLSTYLMPVDMPPEYLQDETVDELSNEMYALQQEFKSIHKQVERLRLTGNTASTLKREIRQMEEERQQVTAKILRMQQRTEQVPKYDQWLQVSKALRSEQARELDLSDRIKMQKNQLQGANQKLAETQQQLKEAKAMNVGTNPQLLLSKMRDEIKMDLYLINEKLPKAIQEKKQYIRTLQRTMSEPVSERELDALESEVKDDNNVVARLMEQNVKQTNVTDDKLGLFHQQAAIVARKKESIADQLQSITNELRSLEAELDRTKVPSQSASKVLQGEELKRYINDVRAKSITYKQKKAELAALTTESGVLERTEEVLKTRERAMKDSYKTLKTSSGSTSSLNLDLDDDPDFDLREAHYHRPADSLDQLQEAITSLKSSIQAKKAALTPMIQELRQTRQQMQSLEVDHAQKKRVYDAAMAGYDSENTQDVEVVRLSKELQDAEKQVEKLHAEIEKAKSDYDRAQEEMRAYRGDPSLEAEQTRRGFKSYRDMFTKKLTDLEHALKAAKDKQREVQASFQDHQRQMELFTHVERVLKAKAEYNRKAILGGVTARDSVADGVALLVHDRLRDKRFGKTRLLIKVGSYSRRQFIQPFHFHYHNMWIAVIVLLVICHQVAPQSVPYRSPGGASRAPPTSGSSPDLLNRNMILLPSYDQTDDVFEIIVDDLGTHYGQSYKRNPSEAPVAVPSFNPRERFAGGNALILGDSTKEVAPVADNVAPVANAPLAVVNVPSTVDSQVAPLTADPDEATSTTATRFDNNVTLPSVEPLNNPNTLAPNAPAPGTGPSPLVNGTSTATTNNTATTSATSPGNDTIVPSSGPSNTTSASSTDDHSDRTLADEEVSGTTRNNAAAVGGIMGTAAFGVLVSLLL